MYVERVAMATKHTGSLYLPLVYSLFRLSLIVISPHSREKFTLILVCESAERHCGTSADHNPAINSKTRGLLHSCQRKNIAGSGSTLSRINVIFFFSPFAEQHNWMQEDQSEPRADNHTLTKEMIVFCSRTGQLRAWDTNVTFFSASYCKNMCLYVNCFALACDDARPHWGFRGLHNGPRLSGRVWAFDGLN